MFYSIKLTPTISAERAKVKARFIARKSIIMYDLKADELVLNKYIQEKYNTDLKNMCLKLLKEASYIASVDELIIKFKDTEADKLARFITYGNGKIKGSKILRDIFRKD